VVLTSNQMEKNIDWLLTNGSAPVRYLTHKHILGKSGSSKAMRSLWHEVEDSQCAREIFGKQEEDSSWHAGGSYGHDGGWADPRHSEQMGWTRSCLFSTYQGVMALYCSRNPAFKKALIRGVEFILWHLSTKKDCDLRQFYYHGHTMVRELVMFSELGIGLEAKAVQTILKMVNDFV
jgi:hypothetical protein